MEKKTNPAAKYRRLPMGLEIIYEDKDILVVNKPAGLLTMGTETNKTRTAYFILTDYVRKGQAKSRNRIFIVHRLDQSTSGVLVFAKNEDAKFRLQEMWENTEKKYIALVHGRLGEKEGIISSYLAENNAHFVYSTTSSIKGKLAKTAYKIIQETELFSLLEINLITGRKNQIRVHLADKGHPIVGDDKYGKKDGHKQLALHAKSISFKHPISNIQMTFETKPPGHINRLISGKT